MSKLSNKILFEDHHVKITDNEVVIKFYYYPIGTKKVIPMDKIRDVEVKKLGWAKGSLWGMDGMKWGYWLAADLERFNKK